MIRLLIGASEIVGELTTGVPVIETSMTLRPDVLVLDLNLPDPSGFAACQEFVGTTPGVRVIILTALNDPKIEREAYRRGVSGFAGKWQMGVQLLPTVQRVWSDDAINSRNPAARYMGDCQGDA